MAILNGIISKLNGSAGNLTFKQLGGKTVVSSNAVVENNRDFHYGDQPPISSSRRDANSVRC